ncbi:MAG TPA: response regulator, partial [Candidatus Competibacteraceae bacterium]|nr:response regulator [Candidatus Competibacteraceae bacterium]
MRPDADCQNDLPLNDITILVVDDVRDNLVLMQALLNGEGFHQVLLAERGQQALDILASRSDVGVVLLDLMMPDMDGYAVCRHIASNPET